MKDVVEEILNRMPEVTWDRWVGELENKQGVGVFGWIERDDGKRDFVMLRIDADGCWMILTSSAKYSADFALRVGFEGPHGNCKRVEEHFHSVKSVKLSASAPSELLKSKSTSLDGLHYALGIVKGRRVLNRAPAYLAALDEIEIFLNASIERVENGEPIALTLRPSDKNRVFYKL